MNGESETSCSGIRGLTSGASLIVMATFLLGGCYQSISQLPAKPDTNVGPVTVAQTEGGKRKTSSTSDSAESGGILSEGGTSSKEPTLSKNPTPELKRNGDSVLIKDSSASPSMPAKLGALPVKISPYDSAWSSVRLTLDSIINQPGFRTASLGILIVHENGDTIYSKNAHKLLVAASNMKVVTAAASLVELGADYRFKPNFLRLGLTDPMPSDYGSTYDVQKLRSGTLGDALAPMMKNSHNRLAEQLFRTIGLEKAKSPTRDSSAAAVTRTLLALGIPQDGFVIHDGSGYDRKNYLSAETLVKLLTIFGKDSIFVNSMTVGGVDGTLMRRFRNTPAMGNIFAKTGSLNGIRSLSGYVYNLAGERVTFAILCNAYSLSPTGINATLDSMIVKLASVDIPPVFAQDASHSKQSTRSNTPKIQNVAH